MSHLRKKNCILALILHTKEFLWAEPKKLEALVLSSRGLQE